MEMKSLIQMIQISHADVFSSTKTACFVILMGSILVSCVKTDPIEHIVRKESSNPTFQSGLTSLLRLPATAIPEQVTLNVLGESKTNIIISEIRHVHISYRGVQLPAEFTNYIAVLVDTKSGRKVVLLQYQNDKHMPGWWSQTYDIK
jgi:hypothetical protein